MLPKKETQDIKNQLIKHIESSFSEEKRESAIKQIELMNPDKIEEFVKKNQIINEKKSKCIFCAIVSKEIESYIVDENNDAIAVLEINPVSKAHTLVIPKNHISSEEKIPDGTFELSKIIAEKMKKFKPKKIDIVPSKMFDHEILNVIPVYKNENLNSNRKSMKKEELEEMQRIFNRKEKKIIEKSKIEKLTGKNLWIPKRIP